MDDDIRTTVEFWKTHRLRESDIPFVSAVLSLKGENPLIEARRTSPSEWTVCVMYITLTCERLTGVLQIIDLDKDVPAVFSTAGLFAASDPYETGNLVMENASPPVGMDVKRV